jgi:hypothetical protein
MGRILHRAPLRQGRIRRAIRHSQENMRALVRRHSIGPGAAAEEALAGARSSNRTQVASAKDQSLGSKLQADAHPAATF